ncbi:OpgC domain-containing protein [uncultured Limimaricola sp.]|uniref:OpgC family protein n=1 Tax=uncultured Limimaricola sp. TaxID=2211667 RepID=UPI0030F59990
MPDAPVSIPVAQSLPKFRDPRLDVLRGIALVMIFINHVPGNFWEDWTSRNFGFSDAAEGFVLMAGISAGLAYSAGFRVRWPWQGVARIWRRAWTLYLVHLLITFGALGIAASLAVFADVPGMLWKHGMGLLFRDPLGFLIGVPTLGFQIGFANILPLYFVLLMGAPLVLWAAVRRPALTLAASALLWLAATHFRLTLPHYPTGGWQFSPPAWQVLFVLGMVTGIAAKQGRRLVPARPWLMGLAVAFLLLSLAWMNVPIIGKTGNHLLWMANQQGLPGFMTSFNKPYLNLPRLLHLLALFYVLASWGAVRRACASRIAAPFALLGRQALPVFALGSITIYLIQGIKTQTGENFALDTMMLGVGLALQLAFAAARHYWPSDRGAAGKTAVAPPPAQALAA